MAENDFKLRAREWFTELPEWLWTVTVRWSTLIGGGMVGIPVYLWDRFNNPAHPFSLGILYWVLGGAFVGSGYDAWLAERRARNAARMERDAALGVNPPKTLRAAAFCLSKSYRDFADSVADDYDEATLPGIFWKKHPFAELERVWTRLNVALLPTGTYPLGADELPTTPKRIREIADDLEFFGRRVPDDIPW